MQFFRRTRLRISANDRPAPYGTCNLLNCIGEYNEEKWSGVTNGRTLILIVSHGDLFIGHERARLIFETLALHNRRCICDSKAIAYAIDWNIRRGLLKEKEKNKKKEKVPIDFPHLQSRYASAEVISRDGFAKQRSRATIPR